jgi:uncharacterized protein YceH (UPF0502 family)
MNDSLPPADDLPADDPTPDAPSPSGAPAAGATVAPELGPAERRVLGVLLEKALATPEYYPLTLNALAAGCNQRSNRDPVMELSVDDVREALSSLQLRHLVMAVKPAGGHATRWRHELMRALLVQPREQAILAELLLRGPQTIGELRTRAGRMREMKDLEEVEEGLAKLDGATPSLAVRLPAEPGSRAPRHADRLRPAAEVEALLAGASPAAVELTARQSRSAAAAAAPDVALLREQVAALTRRIARLETELGLSDDA